MAADRSSFITVIFISGVVWQWIWADALPATLTRESRARFDIVHETVELGSGNDGLFKLAPLGFAAPSECTSMLLKRRDWLQLADY